MVIYTCPEGERRKAPRSQARLGGSPEPKGIAVPAQKRERIILPSAWPPPKGGTLKIVGRTSTEGHVEAVTSPQNWARGRQPEEEGWPTRVCKTYTPRPRPHGALVCGIQIGAAGGCLWNPQEARAEAKRFWGVSLKAPSHGVVSCSTSEGRKSPPTCKGRRPRQQGV
jgi:hypothetical protein